MRAHSSDHEREGGDAFFFQEKGSAHSLKEKGRTHLLPSKSIASDLYDKKQISLTGGEGYPMLRVPNAYSLY